MRALALLLAGCTVPLARPAPVAECLDYVAAVRACHARADLPPPDDVADEACADGTIPTEDAGVWPCMASIWDAGDCATETARTDIASREQDCRSDRP